MHAQLPASAGLDDKCAASVSPLRFSAATDGESEQLSVCAPVQDRRRFGLDEPTEEPRRNIMSSPLKG